MGVQRNQEAPGHGQPGASWRRALLVAGGEPELPLGDDPLEDGRQRPSLLCTLHDLAAGVKPRGQDGVRALPPAGRTLGFLVLGLGVELVLFQERVGVRCSSHWRQAPAGKTASVMTIWKVRITDWPVASNVA